jgi:ribose transport system substrate-binding protein
VLVPAAAPKKLYLIPVLSKAMRILELFHEDNRPQSVESLYAQTQFSRSTVYRIVKTLAHHGYLAQTQGGRYHLKLQLRKLKFGFANLSAEHPIASVIESSLRVAATSAGIELIVLNNLYDAAQAIANVDEFLRERVQLVIEFQADQNVAPIVADKLNSAAIPFIAIDIPHPHAVFFGVDNFHSGFEAGECLGQHAQQAWRGKVSWVIGLTVAKAGPLVQSRITGAFEGVRSRLKGVGEENFLMFDDNGLRENSYKKIRDFLKRHPKDHGILIASVSDTSALGAVRAVRELKRVKDVAILGHDCIEEAMHEICTPGTPLIGSVSHGMANAGPELIRLGLAILNNESVPPYNYLKHELISARSLLQRRRAH